MIIGQSKDMKRLGGPFKLKLIIHVPNCSTLNLTTIFGQIPISQE